MFASANVKLVVTIIVKLFNDLSTFYSKLFKFFRYHKIVFPQFVLFCIRTAKGSIVVVHTIIHENAV